MDIAEALPEVSVPSFPTAPDVRVSLPAAPAAGLNLEPAGISDSGAAVGSVVQKQEGSPAPGEQPAAETPEVGVQGPQFASKVEEAGGDPHEQLTTMAKPPVESVPAPVGEGPAAAGSTAQEGEKTDAAQGQEALTPSQQLDRVQARLQEAETATEIDPGEYLELKRQEADLLEAGAEPSISQGEQPQTAKELSPAIKVLDSLFDIMQKNMSEQDMIALMNTAGVAIEKGNPPEQQTKEPQTMLQLISKLILGLLITALKDELNGIQPQQIQQLSQNIDAAFASQTAVGEEATAQVAPSAAEPAAPAVTPAPAVSAT